MFLVFVEIGEKKNTADLKSDVFKVYKLIFPSVLYVDYLLIR